MRIEPENNNVSIVLVGSLSPDIFHPSWFAANNLLSKADVDGAEIEVCHKNITIFKIGDRLRVQVDSNRFIAVTSEPPYVTLYDLVVRTFGEALPHTPLTMLGINRQVHFSTGDEEIRNRIGKRLAPQDAWGEWASLIEGKNPQKRGGMISLSMRQNDLEDREIGFLQAKVEPSLLIKNKTGILVDVNDHYQVSQDDSSFGSMRIMEILTKQFDNSIQRSEWIIDQIMALKEEV